MNARAGRLAVVGQVALSAAWFMSSAVYLFTPPRMAAALAMSDAVRYWLGSAMFVSASTALIGVMARSRPISIAALSLLSIEGAAWAAYDALRHWPVFAAYDATLACTAIGLLLTRARKR